MLLSIVVAAYNKEKYISRCLESLIRIEEKNVEFIVVNDGSTDATAEVCKYYEHIDSRIHVIHKENSGVSGARNAGIECSQGKYIGFVDGDDELTEEYRKIIAVLTQEEEELFCFDYCEQNENMVINQEKKWLTPGKNDRRILLNGFLSGSLNSVCMNIYCSNIIKKYCIRFTEGMTMGEDCEFNSKYVKYCTGVYYIDEVAYRYDISNADSATHKLKLNYLKDFVRMYQAYVNVYQMESDLCFGFDYDLYLGFVYEIIRTNAKIMTVEDNKNFRDSMFFEKLISHPSKSLKKNIKKIYIKYNIYRIVKF